MLRFTIICTIVFLPLLTTAQKILTGAATRWNDSFVEWILFTDNEEEEGELKMRWIQQNDWTQWDYRIGEEFGRIEAKWKNRQDEWEVRADNQTITMRTMWSGDFSEWKITDNNRTFKIKSRYNNRADEWILNTEEYGYFSIYTNWEGDPREWEIIDELDEEITLPMKMAMVFIVLFNSSPRL